MQISHECRFQSTTLMNPCFFLYILLTVFIAGCDRCPNAEKGNENPKSNIILITVDTLRADHLGVYGHYLGTSPEFDRFSQHSKLFTQCYTNVPKTAPALASMLTGTLPIKHLVTFNHYIIAENLSLISSRLKSEGYYTAGIQTNFMCRRECGFARGFDEYLEVIRPGPYKVKSDKIEFVNPVIFKWLNEHKNDLFFLWIHYLDPHGPYTAPNPYHRVFNPDEYDCSIDTLQIADDHDGYGMIPKYQAVIDSNNPADYIAAYDGEIRYWDTHFGRLMRFIQHISFQHPCSFFVTSDHGESMTENNYYFEHGAFLYESGVHIPLMAKINTNHSSGLFPGHVRLMDISPTILDYLKFKPLELADGRSFMDVFCANGSKELDFNVPLQTSSQALQTFRSSGIISGNHKLIDYTDDELQADQLFDHLKDPAENTNIMNTENGPLFNDLKMKKNELLEQNFTPPRKPGKSTQILRSDAVEVLKTLGYIQDESELPPITGS